MPVEIVFLFEKMLENIKMKNKIFKVKDSVDLFLSDEKYIMAYYMNSRQRKSFRVNKEMIRLFEIIDGVKTVAEIEEIMRKELDADAQSIDDALQGLEDNRIITEVYISDDILSFDEQERYTRQINYFTEFLGGEREGVLAQKKIIDSHIIIFGCGSVGGGLAIELAMAGVGRFTLYDFDKVEKSDISRHIYYSEEYVGLPKVEALRKAILSVNPNCLIECINMSMKPSDDIEDIITAGTFVVNTLDEPYIGYTSSKISRICVKHDLPHYIAGGFDAHLASTGEIIVPYLTPCVECYSGYFKNKLKDWKPKKHPVKTRYMEIGGLASMTLFSVSYAAIEILKYIAELVNFEEDYKVRGELLFQDLSLTYLNVNKNPECPICGEGSLL